MQPHRTAILVLSFSCAMAVAAGAATDETPPVATAEVEPQPVAAVADPAATIVAAVADSTEGVLLGEVLERNPDLARFAAAARAAEQVAPQVRALPDPTAAVTAFLLTPESRVGPQRVMASLSQRLPWFGNLSLREQAATYAATAAQARLAARRLELVTEARRLYLEVGFLDTWTEVIHLDRATLARYEELARTRYAAGFGLEQAVVKIQAEITRDDTRLLEIARRRATVVASLNAVRDLPQGTALPRVELPEAVAVELAPETLRRGALERRLELAAATAEIERAATQVELAHKSYSPDVTLGLTYTLVTGRDDPAGRLSPPPDNGQDVLGVTGAVNLPIWRSKLDAGVEEAVQTRLAAEQAQRATVAGIDGVLGDLGQRIPLIWQQLRLYDQVLVVQAREALRSAESAYAAGTINALDLLDAERVLLDVRTGTARARADYAIAVAQLEGAVGGPLASVMTREEG